MQNTGHILAIEAAIQGGSIAVLKSDGEVIKWHSQEKTARAEDLLANISDILETSGIDKRQLGQIAVANGPGSYTGIRIGLATALGLARALDIECVGVPLLPSIAKAYGDMKRCVVALPIGRSEVCWQAFDGAASTTEVQTGQLRELLSCFGDSSCDKLLLHADIFEKAGKDFNAATPCITNIGSDLAEAIALAASTTDSDLTPNYLARPAFTNDAR